MMIQNRLFLRFLILSWVGCSQIFFLSSTEASHPVLPDVRLEESVDRKDLFSGLEKALRLTTANKRYVLTEIFHLPERAEPESRLYSSSLPPLVFSKYGLSTRLKLQVSELPLQIGRLKLNVISHIYEYPKSEGNEVRFVVNFADHKLFQFWRGSLFAQDEMQVLEHPELGLLRDSLESKNPRILDLNAKEYEVGTFQNVQRMGMIDPSRIYGNRFFISPHEILEDSIEVLFEPTLSNILAMPAPRAQRPGTIYTKEDVETLFYTAYTGFSAARLRSADLQLVIDTGNWGTGAFGNNPKVVAIAQLLAAHAAGVDILNYHTVSIGMDRHVEFALNWIETKTSSFENSPTPLKEWLRILIQEKFRYGKSNGT